MNANTFRAHLVVHLVLSPQFVTTLTDEEVKGNCCSSIGQWIAPMSLLQAANEEMFSFCVTMHLCVHACVRAPVCDCGKIYLECGCACTCVCMSVRVCACIHASARACVCLSRYACVHACARVCACVCACVCMRMRVCLRVNNVL